MQLHLNGIIYGRDIFETYYKTAQLDRSGLDRSKSVYPEMLISMQPFPGSAPNFHRVIGGESGYELAQTKLGHASSAILYRRSCPFIAGQEAPLSVA